MFGIICATMSGRLLADNERQLSNNPDFNGQEKETVQNNTICSTLMLMVKARSTEPPLTVASINDRMRFLRVLESHPLAMTTDQVRKECYRTTISGEVEVDNEAQTW